MPFLSPRLPLSAPHHRPSLSLNSVPASSALAESESLNAGAAETIASSSRSGDETNPPPYASSSSPPGILRHNEMIYRQYESSRAAGVVHVFRQEAAGDGSSIADADRSSRAGSETPLYFRLQAEASSSSSSPPGILRHNGMIYRQFESSRAAGVVSGRNYVPFFQLEAVTESSRFIIDNDRASTESSIDNDDRDSKDEKPREKNVGDDDFVSNN